MRKKYRQYQFLGFFWAWLDAAVKWGGMPTTGKCRNQQEDDEETHCIIAEMYSCFGRRGRPFWSISGDISYTVRIVAMVIHKFESAICFAGQALGQRTVWINSDISLKREFYLLPKPKAATGSRALGSSLPSFMNRSGLNSNGSG